MSMHAAEQETSEPTAPTTEREMLDFVYRELVGIHASIEDTTHSDKTIIPWTSRELMDLIRTLGAFRKAQRETSQSAGAGGA
jgi:hypothetical protein